MLYLFFDEKSGTKICIGNTQTKQQLKSYMYFETFILILNLENKINLVLWYMHFLENTKALIILISLAIKPMDRQICWPLKKCIMCNYLVA